MGRSCNTYGERRSVYRVLVGKPEGRRQLGRPRRGWQGNVKMGFGEVGWGHGQDEDSTLFPNTLSLCSSHNVNDQVSHPYKKKGFMTYIRNITHFNPYILLLK